jgi:release factor glutamine methyltransferase
VTNGSPSAGRLLERGASELAKVGVDDSRWEAELLLRHAFGCSREHLLARLQEPVPAEAMGHFFQLVDRRRGRVPIQYLLGTQEFFGLSFRVTPAVLIPRPETEGLVEQALLMLAQKPRPRIADVGCGSGCIATAIALSLRQAELFAIDASEAALAVARENTQQHGVSHRIELMNGNLLAPLLDRSTPALDAVVTNPPYISDEELEKLAPEVIGHEPRVALAGGKEGLGVIAELLPQVAKALRPEGLLFMEIGCGQEARAGELVRDSGMAVVRVAPDLAGIPRVVVARKQ